MLASFTDNTTLNQKVFIMPSQADDIAKALHMTYVMRNAAYGTTKLSLEIKDLERIKFWITFFESINDATFVTELDADTVKPLAAAVSDAWLYGTKPGCGFERAAWWVAHKAAPPAGLQFVFEITPQQAVAAKNLFSIISSTAHTLDDTVSIDQVLQMSSIFIKRFKVASFSGTMLVLDAAFLNTILDSLTSITIIRSGFLETNSLEFNLPKAVLDSLKLMSENGIQTLGVWVTQLSVTLELNNMNMGLQPTR